MVLAEFVRDLPRAAGYPQPAVYADPGYTGPHGRRIASRIGPIVVDAQKLIAAPRGLFGFEALRQFALLRLPPARFGPLGLIQCLDDPSAAFLFHADIPTATLYRPGDLESAGCELGIAADDAATLILVTARPVPVGLTMNLRAPVLVDTARRLAFQHILASGDYPLRFKPWPAAAAR